MTEPDPTKDLDVLALLARVERQGSSGTGGVLSVEVDSLLGRPSRPSLKSSLAERKPQQEDDSKPHAWYFELLRTVPEVPTQFRVARAARAVEAGVLAEERLEADVWRTVEEFEDLVAVAEHGKAEYRFLVESNLRLVFHWARRQQYLIGEDAVQDAFQAGCLGLMRGIQGWDHELGFTLSTYVSSHIRQAIQRWRHDNATTIRLPVHVWEKLESDANELSLHVRQAAEAAQHVEPLQSVDVYSAEFAWDGGLDEVVDLLDREDLVGAMLDSLSDREALVLRLRHGIDDRSGGHTLEEIGNVVGVTRERIRQIESKAEKKLREMFAAYAPPIRAADSAGEELSASDPENDEQRGSKVSDTLFGGNDDDGQDQPASEPLGFPPGRWTNCVSD